MTSKTWNFTIEGQPHMLTLDHGVFSGNRSITLDGDLLEYIPRNLIDAGGMHLYQINGHSLTVIIQSKLTRFEYDLLVDGISLATGERGPRYKGNSSRQGAVFLAVLMLIIGFVISAVTKNDYDKQLMIQEWPVVTGEIAGINSDYHPDTDDDNTDDSYYHAVLTINYTAGDINHTTQFDDEKEFDSSGLAMTVHRIGEKQDLYVNPENPQDVSLYFEKLEPNGWIGTSLVIMGMFTLMAIFFIVGVWFQTRKQSPLPNSFQYQ